jgi:perosamine synthetase
MDNLNFNICNFIKDLYPDESTIPLHRPIFNGNEKKYLIDCIDSTYVSSVGEYVNLFEKKIKDYTSAKHAIVCVNGTNALHIALKYSGVENDDEVITQSISFVATSNAILYCGAKPVFLDIDLNSLGLSYQALKDFLEKNTFQKNNYCYNRKTNKIIRACVPVHVFGHPLEIDRIVSLCHDHNIKVIEDAAESLGSLYKGKHTGTFGDIGVLSLNGNKIITAGGGGVVLVKDDSIAKKIKHVLNQAKESHSWEFFHKEIGYNYRMPNINAALALAQLEKLDSHVNSKRIIAKKYEDFFINLNVKFLSEPSNSVSNYWLNSIIFNSSKEKESFLRYSNNNKILTRPIWTPLNRLPFLSNFQKDNLINTSFIYNRLVNVPSSVPYNKL